MMTSHPYESKAKQIESKASTPPSFRLERWAAEAAAYKSAAPRQRLQGVLNQKAKTLKTQAELGGEASPPSAASTSAADLARTAGKRRNNVATMLEKSTPKRA